MRFEVELDILKAFGCKWSKITRGRLREAKRQQEF